MGTAMPRRSADHRTMVRRALLCRLSVPHWPPRRPRQPATGCITRRTTPRAQDECRCDNYCDNFCDDEPNGCARTCRILNGVFQHIPSVHAGDRTCTWHAYSVTNPIDYEGYDCSW